MQKKLWFRRRRFGWGWFPITWQGWLVVLAYVAGMVVVVTSVMRERNTEDITNPNSGSNVLVTLVPLIFLILLLVFICYKKGEKPRWHWGWHDEEK